MPAAAESIVVAAVAPADPAPQPRSHPRAVRAAAVTGAYVLLAIALTWPVAATFRARLGGDGMDAFQTLWGLDWVATSLLHLRNPFFTGALFYPTGVTLVYQTWSLPDAVAAVPLWLVLPPYAVYNTLVVASFTTTALGMYALVRDVTGSTAAALFAGATFTACSFHTGHAPSQYHLLPLGFLPLYLMFLLRAIRGGRLGDAAWGGLCLALATYSSPYQLLFAAIWTIGLFAHGALAHRSTFLSLRMLRSSLVLAALFALVAGPWLVAMARHVSAMTGAHDATFYSADLQGFVMPNGRSAWAALNPGWTRWTGNAPENAEYLGFVLVVLAIAATRRSSLARALGGVAVAAAILALGPALHVGGVVSHRGALPYAWLVRALPQLSFAGCPDRFGLVTEGSLVVMAAIALARWQARLRGVRAFAVIALPLAAALVELWPAPMPTTDFAVPPPLRAWAHDPRRFAVLDVSGFGQSLWNQLQHRKPIVGGYITRTPAALLAAMYRDPALGPIVERGRYGRRLERNDAVIDFAWGEAAPDARLLADHFRVTWDGEVTAERDGEYGFALASDDGARLFVDGRLVVDNGGDHALTRVEGVTQLAAGRHRLHVDYEEGVNLAGVSLRWWGPGFQSRLVAPPGGFRGAYYDRRVAFVLTPAETAQRLRALGIRYVISRADESAIRDAIARLQLPIVWDGDGLLVAELR